jgi:hypothetical protein
MDGHDGFGGGQYQGKKLHEPEPKGTIANQPVSALTEGLIVRKFQEATERDDIPSVWVEGVERAFQRLQALSAPEAPNRLASATIVATLEASTSLS